MATACSSLLPDHPVVTCNHGRASEPGGKPALQTSESGRRWISRSIWNRLPTSSQTEECPLLPRWQAATRLCVRKRTRYRPPWRPPVQPRPATSESPRVGRREASPQPTSPASCEPQRPRPVAHRPHRPCFSSNSDRRGIEVCWTLDLPQLTLKLRHSEVLPQRHSLRVVFDGGI